VAVPLLVYTLIRLGLIVVAWVVLALCGLTGVLWFAVAVVISVLVSYVAFRGQRDRAARYLANRATRRRERGTRISDSIDADADAEDAAFEAEPREPTAPVDREGTGSAA
jgi:hypothetical protein